MGETYQNELKIVLQFILNQNIEKEEEIPIPEYALLDRNFVQILTKKLSNILYNSYKNNTISTNERFALISLLKKFVTNNLTNHLPVTKENEALFLYILNKNNTQKVEKLQYKKFLEDGEIPQEQFTGKNIMDIVEKKYEKYQEKKEKISFVKNWDVSKLEKNGFQVGSVSKYFGNNSIDNSIKFLNNLKLFECTNDSIKKKEINAVMEVEILENTRTKICFGYSLLQHPRTELKENLFIDVLKELKANKNIEERQKFVENLWENQDYFKLSPNILVNILSNFKYIFEKLFTNIATEVLEKFETEELDLIEEYLNSNIKVQNLINIVKENRDLVLDVSKFLQKLLILSNYDLRIMYFTNLIKKHFFVG